MPEKYSRMMGILSMESLVLSMGRSNPPFSLNRLPPSLPPHTPSESHNRSIPTFCSLIKKSGNSVEDSFH